MIGIQPTPTLSVTTSSGPMDLLITAEDIAWNINTSRDQERANYIATVANLTADVPTRRPSPSTSSGTRPEANPLVQIYFLPKHIWEAQADAATIQTYDGPRRRRQRPLRDQRLRAPEASLTMVANDNYYDGPPAVDKVIFRYFGPDAMVAALERGEIDAADGVPARFDGGPGS